MAKAKKKTKKKAATKKKSAKKKAVKKKTSKKKSVKKKAAKKKTAKKAVKKKAVKKKTAKKKAAKKKTAKKAAKKKTAKKTAKKKAVKKEAIPKKVPSDKKSKPQAIPKKAAPKKSAKKIPKKTEEEMIIEEVKNLLSQTAPPKKEAKPKKSVDEEGVLNIRGDEEQVLDALAEEIWGNEVDEDEVVLTDAEGNPYCKAKDCDQLSVVDGYCRYHYILLWKRIQNRKRILAGGKLDRYIEELTARYPDKYLEMLRKDLATEKDFLAIVAELDIDENLNDGDFEDDDTENYIQEMRGVASTSKDDGDDY